MLHHKFARFSVGRVAIAIQQEVVELNHTLPVLSFRHSSSISNLGHEDIYMTAS